MSFVGVMLMPVDTANLDGVTIDKQLAVKDADSAETYLLRNLLNNGTVGLLQLQVKGVKVRILGTPKAWIIDLDFHAVEFAVAALWIPFVHTGSFMGEVKHFICRHGIAANRTSVIKKGGY